MNGPADGCAAGPIDDREFVDPDPIRSRTGDGDTARPEVPEPIASVLAAHLDRDPGEPSAGAMKAALLCLATYAAEDADGLAAPGTATLAGNLGYSPKLVRRCLQALMRRGVIEMVRAPAPRRPAAYRIALR